MDDKGSYRAALNKRLNKMAAILAVCLASAGAIKISERSETRSAGHIIESVVAIGVGNNVHGAGVVLRNGQVLTVNHVIENLLDSKEGIVVTYRDGRSTSATVVKRNRHFDIAVLDVLENRAPGLSLGDEGSLKVGDHVRAIGHPFGILWMISDGIVSRKSYFPTGADGSRFVIWTTAWIESGNSGGPLVNDDGEIVGLVMAFINPRGNLLGAKHLNICVSASEIKRFLENQ